MKESNQRGASIIEVMIMSGVMVAMMMGFMSLMSHESKSVTYLEDRLSRVALENELRMHFTGADFCKNLLEGLVAPQENKTEDISKSLTKAVQKAALEKVFQKRGNKTVYDQLELKKITLEDSNLTSSNSSGEVSLNFYPERLRKGGGPPSLQPIRIKTAVSVGAGYKIESCQAEGEGSGKSCPLSDVRDRFPTTVHLRYCTASGTGYYAPGALSKLQAEVGIKVYDLLKGTSVEVPSQQLISGSALWTAKHVPSYGLSYQMQCAEGEWNMVSVGTGDVYSAIKYNKGGTPKVPGECSGPPMGNGGTPGF